MFYLFWRRGWKYSQKCLSWAHVQMKLSHIEIPKGIRQNKDGYMSTVWSNERSLLIHSWVALSKRNEEFNPSGSDARPDFMWSVIISLMQRWACHTHSLMQNSAANSISNNRVDANKLLDKFLLDWNVSEQKDVSAFNKHLNDLGALHSSPLGYLWALT